VALTNRHEVAHDPHAVLGRAGHSSVEFTMKQYGYALRTDNEIGKALDEELSAD
jgi:hypothetical protein